MCGADVTRPRRRSGQNHRSRRTAPQSLCATLHHATGHGKNRITNRHNPVGGGFSGLRRRVLRVRGDQLEDESNSGEQCCQSERHNDVEPQQELGGVPAEQRFDQSGAYLRAYDRPRGNARTMGRSTACFLISCCAATASCKLTIPLPAGPFGPNQVHRRDQDPEPVALTETPRFPALSRRLRHILARLVWIGWASTSSSTSSSSTTSPSMIRASSSYAVIAHLRLAKLVPSRFVVNFDSLPATGETLRVNPNPILSKICSNGFAVISSPTSILGFNPARSIAARSGLQPCLYQVM